ncbi:MAG: AAA family ATPase [Eubacteriales bacterium]|nr:AAA family ATPase [Eubacteriales bacterium]
MAWCILVSGMPAAGKSTLCRALSLTLNVPILSKDEIKELLFDTVGFSCREEKVRLGQAAEALVHREAAQLMASGASFVLENNYERGHAAPLQASLRQYGIPYLAVFLTGDPAVLYQRFIARNAAPGRHLGHVVNDHYPRRSGDAPPDPAALSEQAFLHFIQARGMDVSPFAERCLTVDTTAPGAPDATALAKRIQALILSPDGQAWQKTSAFD